jgi:glycosyltransferase involved in cell wall biosynthesis
VKLLFVTWDGPGTAYHESLFVPLLRRARNVEDDVALLQFTWGAAGRSRDLHHLADAEDMRSMFQTVPRGRAAWRLPLVLGRGVLLLLREVGAGRSDLVLARSIIPGALVAVMRRLSRTPFAFVYDADGLPADERVEFGGWRRRGLRYRIFRWLERAALRSADVVITRTSPAVEVLRRRSGRQHGRFVVVANGKDQDQFTPKDDTTRRRARERLAIPLGAPVVVYVGSVGPQYEPRFMLETFHRILHRSDDAHLVLLVPEAHHERLRAMAVGIPPGRLRLRSSRPSDVPGLLAACDLGLAFRTPTFSQRAVAPIKVAEYLLCGVPTAYTAGVGDLAQQLGDDVSIAVTAHDTSEADRVARWFELEVLAHREERRLAARRQGLSHFSLDVGAAGYRRAFDLAVAGR